jgi:hypothetical protein
MEEDMTPKTWTFGFDLHADVGEHVRLVVDYAKRKDLDLEMHIRAELRPSDETLNAGTIDPGKDRSVSTFSFKTAMRLKEPSPEDRAKGILPMPDHILADQIARAVVDLGEKVRAEGQRRQEQYLRDLVEKHRPKPIADDQKKRWADEAHDLLVNPDLMEKISEEIGRFMTGEVTLRKLDFLVKMSSVLRDSTSVIVKGQSAVGKSATAKAVAKIVPQEYIINASSMSPMWLAYSCERGEFTLAYKTLFVFEAAALSEEGIGSVHLRTLLSEKRIEHHTVRGGSPVTMTTDGPCNLITTTTDPELEKQLETRCMSVYANETKEHSYAIVDWKLEAAGKDEDEPEPDGAVLALQHHIRQSGVHRAVIPFEKALGTAMRQTDVRAVRLRRDIDWVISLVQTSAILHLDQREKTPKGTPIATLADYRLVQQLLSGPWEASLTGITPDQRAVVAKVEELQRSKEDGVTYVALGDALGVSDEAIRQRCQKLLKRGILTNQEKVANKAARLVLGTVALDNAPLPDPDFIAKHYVPQ